MPRPSAIFPLILVLAAALAPARIASARADHPEAAHPAGASESHAEPNILEFKPATMVVTMIIFGTLFAILWKFAWGPLSHALAERERKQEEVIRAAEDARSESARLLVEHKKQMQAASEQVRQMMEEARRQADENAQSIVQKAQAEAEASRERAEREIGTAKDQALSEIWTKTADLAVSVAGKVLSKEMSGDDHRRLVDAAMSELPSANGHGSRLA